jgi:hypothetical protein
MSLRVNRCGYSPRESKDLATHLGLETSDSEAVLCTPPLFSGLFYQKPNKLTDMYDNKQHKIRHKISVNFKFTKRICSPIFRLLFCNILQ